MTIAARRVVFPERGRVVIEEFELPAPGPQQVLVRTLRTAVSAGTELTGLLGDHPRARFPVYPGYSHVGVVEAVGDGVEAVGVGDHVLSMGGHQSHLLLDLAPSRPAGPAYSGRPPGPDYLERLPEGLGPDQAAFAILGSVALHGIRKAELQLGAAVAVLGQGIVGQLLVQLARAGGCRPVIAVDLVTDRLERARTSGAHLLVDAGQEDLAEAVMRATDGRGVEAAFDATRTPSTLPTMMKIAAMGGKVLMVGSVMGTVEIDAFSELQLKELQIIGCFQPSAPLTEHHAWPWTQRRNRRLFLELLADGSVRLDHLITHTVPFTEAPEIFAMIRRGGTDWLGVVFTWEA